MKILIAYDKWCLSTLEAILTWFNEWLSVSQRVVEKALIILYVFAPIVNVPRPSAFISISFCGLIGVMLWIQALEPEAVREARAHAPGVGVLRVCMQVFAICVMSMPPHGIKVDIGVGLQMCSYVLFQYSVSIGNTGERGRHRALSMAKLKELFGTEWMPQPEMMPR